MLPHIEQFESVERIRDGGSLAASWRTNGINFWLFFKIQYDQKSGDHIGFEEPIIVNRSIDLAEDITWEYAEKILKLIPKESMTERDQQMLLQMKLVSLNKGSICERTKFHLNIKNTL